MFLRSSAIGTLSFCEQKYYNNYVLGMKDKENLRANMGTIFHAVMETLAIKKLAIQNNEDIVKTEFGTFTLEEADDIEHITNMAYYHYKNQSCPTLKWTDKCRRDIIEWVHEALNYNGQSLDPRNQNIFSCEDFFDLEIKQPWARYSYRVGDELIDGYLRLKGTVDLIVTEDVDNKILHILDYKTGRRLNWATGKIKEHADFYKDHQLLFYYYALRNKYPDYDFLVSIYYVNDHNIDGKLVEGGVFTVVFDDHDYQRAEDMIRQKFEYIKSVEAPKLLCDNNTHWKCKYLCAYSQQYEDTDKTICQHIRDEIIQKGIHYTTEQYGDLDKITFYGEGGGKKHDIDSSK